MAFYCLLQIQVHDRVDGSICEAYPTYYAYLLFLQETYFSAYSPTAQIIDALALGLSKVPTSCSHRLVCVGLGDAIVIFHLHNDFFISCARISGLLCTIRLAFHMATYCISGFTKSNVTFKFLDLSRHYFLN